MVIAGYRNGYDYSDDEVFQEILTLQPDIVMVALGIPRQELLIDRWYHRFHKGVFVGVGGTFDVLSGTKRRAPKFFRSLNMEWLYRILREPKRLSLIHIWQRKNRYRQQCLCNGTAEERIRSPGAEKIYSVNGI